MTTMVMVATAGGAQAPSCAVARGAVVPLGMSGARIASVTIVTEPPRVAPRALERVIHGRTRPGVIRRELLFAAGDTVDTLRVAESMRRLRSLGLLDDAYVEARRCSATTAGGDGGGPVDIRVVTRDAWSTTPVVRLRGSSASVGVNERNALGSGVALRATAQDDGGRLGVATSARAPGLPWSGAAVEVGGVAYRNGGTWFGAVGPRSAWPTERWIVDGRLAESEQEPRSQPGAHFQRGSSSLFVGRRVGDTARQSSYLLAGAEGERADLTLANGAAPVVGPRFVHRDYAGLALGAVRASARFDTVSWLLPGSGVADVPRGTEGAMTLGAGRDRMAGRTAGHVDLWTGRAFSRPGSGSVAVGDVWASGYFGDELLSASTVRGSLVLLRQAPRGLWTFRVAGERLMRPDPDVHALALLDPAAAALPRPSRFAEAAFAASAERDVHLRAVTGSLGVDGALFAAGSFHWDPTLSGSNDNLGVAVVGAGLRLAPWHTPRNTIRLDVGMPLIRTPGVRSRPYVAISVVPWPLLGRERDGRRLP
ncbi:MAG TPA: hypothetical protein VFJ74_10975 [Gemmatimonadaceae bacterium]|nr:hypothetical protein [Gemmatimonadaceae bacterium]